MGEQLPLSLGKDGWLQGVTTTPSPNFDARPAGETVSLIVIHGISLPAGVFGTPYIDDLFCNRIRGDEVPGFESLADLRVSSHLLIRRGGEPIQYVSLHDRAWHAGVSSFQGRTHCNDFSIGIELEGTDETPYTDAQYQCLYAVVGLLLQQFPNITPEERIVGHCDIAPGRKSDPGPAFDWQRLREATL